jgi:hypothetical protein
MFEFLLCEWHLTPDYILANWTDELFNLMVDKLVDRKERETAAMRGTSREHSTDNKVSDLSLFAQAGNLIKVVKKNGN